MAKQRILGTAGRDRIDLAGKIPASGTDGFDVFAGAEKDHVTGSDFHDILRGEAGDDTLEGGKGNDVLLGGAGNDALDGGEGIDTASYAGQAGFVDASLATGFGKVTTFATGSFALLPVTELDTLKNIENLTAGDGGSRLTGNASANVLTGGRGEDILFGGGGNDTLVGGDGADTASYAGQTMFVSVNLANGTGRVISPANLVVEQDTLSGIENAIAGNGGSLLVGNDADNRLTGGQGRDTLRGGIGVDTLLGGAERDTLEGGEGADLLLGGVGNDTIDGGDGIDTVSYAGQSDFIKVDLASGYGQVMLGIAFTELDTLIGIENATAGNDGSLLIGSSGDNVLTGGAGADELRGGGGNDALIGGAGIDTASYAGQNFFVDVNLAAGTGRVVSPFNLVVEDDTLSGIENVIAGNGGSHLVGDGADNRLVGGKGIDVVEGAGGDDTFIGGGRGADTFNGGEGIDTLSFAGQDVNVQALFMFNQVSVVTDLGVINHSIDSVENVTVGDGGSRVDANDADNTLTGGAGSDVFVGYGGQDTLIGNGGDDVLKGGEGLDTLIGGAGADVLSGNAGNDTLTGGANADTFFFSTESFTGGPGLDRITDFDVASDEHDALDIGQLLGSMPNLTGDAYQDAISQGYLILVQLGEAGASDSSTLVIIDRDGGPHLEGDLMHIAQLDGVTASALQAQHFII